MAIHHGGSAPYAPAQTVIEDDHRLDNWGLAVPFTNDVLVRAGITEALTPGPCRH